MFKEGDYMPEGLCDWCRADEGENFQPLKIGQNNEVECPKCGEEFTVCSVCGRTRNPQVLHYATFDAKNRGEIFACSGACIDEYKRQIGPVVLCSYGAETLEEALERNKGEQREQETFNKMVQSLLNANFTSDEIEKFRRG